MKKIFRPGMALWLLLFCLPSSAAQTDKPTIIVFAAASLTNALQEVGDGFTKDSSIPVKFSFAASSALARQIENGAPADVFFSADIEWMDYLQSRKQIQILTRHDVFGNQLVLVAPADSKIVLKIGPHFVLAKTLGMGRLATGDPDSVPVGRYAREALTKLGVWSEVEARLVRADSVRSALAFVDRGEASLGIVYATDAQIDHKVRVVDAFPDNTHVPIIYPIALTAMAKADAINNCDEHLCLKGDRVRNENLRRWRDETKILLEHSKSAESDGIEGADRWTQHQTRTLTRVEQILEVYDDQSVPNGAVIQPAWGSVVSWIAQGREERRLLDKMHPAGAAEAIQQEEAL